MKPKNTYTSGIYAEYLAAVYLWLKGYKIIARRFKTKMGEIDLIAQKGKTIICVEVKYRGDMDSALGAVSEFSRRRIENAARIYMSQSRRMDMSVRFDVIAITWPFFIRHIDNAWLPTA
jgi:putative endonuclease